MQIAPSPHRPVAQSLFTRQACPTPQPPHIAPPQSMSVSLPSFLSLRHAAAVGCAVGEALG